MEWKESEMVKKDEAEKRILCIGKIHKGKKTMIFAFPRKGGNGDGMKHLFARLTILDIRTDGYKLYCYRRYGIVSMTELSSDQINEQTKLLDSLKRPTRLREFKALLEKIAVEDQEAAKMDTGEPADVPEQDLNGTISPTRPIAVVAGKANAPAFM